jgi:hypothetical protein
MPPAQRPHPHSGYVPRAATHRRRPAPPGRARTDLATLATRLTPRDLWLTEMLHEHKVLTSHHITDLAFTGHRTANRRLRELYYLGVLDSFRPLTQTGSAPEHYTLGRTGADLLAATRGCDPKALNWRKDTCARTAFSPTLTHTLAINTLLTRLAAHPAHALTTWLSERSATRLWGDWIHPDAYAHYHQHGPDRHDGHNAVLPFFLEYDTGTENPARLESKLPGYAALNTTTGTRTPLLLHTRTARREATLRARLTEAIDRLDLPAATSCDELTPASPTDPVWLPFGPARHGRLPLARLGGHWPDLVPALTDDTTMPPPARATAWPWRPVPPLPPTGQPD